jgi:alpha-1,6-mannosyltransferase
MASITMLAVGFTDYENEAEPAVQALRRWDLAGFAGHLPAYGGSLVLRVPFALLPNVWGGGDLAAFRSLAVPCLLAAVALGLALWRPGRAGWVALAVCVANPLTLRALDLGHPEELLGAALCAGAALAAVRDRPQLAGLLLGLALGNKAWALLAVGPVLLALPRGTRVRALTIAVPLAALLSAPMLLGGAGGVAAAATTSQASVIFQPWQLWWFTGSHGQAVHGLYSLKVGYRTAPSWVAPVAHPLLVLTGLGLAAAWGALSAGDRRPRGDALGLLALVLGARCVLDPWNTAYYALPCILALAAWEAGVLRRTPVLAVAATVLTQLTLVELPPVASADVQAAVYLAWAVPGLVLLAIRLAAPHGRVVTTLTALGRSLARTPPDPSPLPSR